MKKSIYKNIISALGITPQTISGATAIEGTYIDRLKYRSAKVIVGVGTVTGTPTSVAHTFVLQDSTATASGFATPSQGAQLITAIATTALEYELDVDLDSCKRYIRIYATPVFVGGTTPAQPVSCHVVLGDALVEPVV
jgi:hypothetical protein